MGSYDEIRPLKERIGTLGVARSLLAHAKLKSTIGTGGIEVNDALAMSEYVDF
jgi:hypothetical protein